MIRQIAEGNKRVFESVFRDYYSRLCGFAYSLIQDYDQSEEVVQDFFTDLWNKRESLEIRNLESYLFQSVKNRCFNYLKHLKVREVHAKEAPHLSPSYSDETEEIVQANELQYRYEQAVQKLPEKRKQVFVLSRSEGLSYKEIAEQTGTSVKTVENQMGQALKFLREELKEYLPVIALLIFLGLGWGLSCFELSCLMNYGG
ncbi:RNA polymerase sigma-70 factor [bacterium SCSIO 12741]|nr:RNA polymerase sigma-70 factor [bacterium SCSIO 12741]